MSKQFKISFKIKNNRLAELREKFGLTQTELHKKTNIPLQFICGLENLTISPFKTVKNEDHEKEKYFHPRAIDLALFFGVHPSYLFSDEIKQVKQVRSEKAFHLSEISELITSQIRSLPPTSFDECAAQEQIAKILEEEMQTRLSSRQQAVLKKRFFENKTYKKIGEEMGGGIERIRQIEARALREIRKFSHMSTSLRRRIDAVMLND